MTSEGIIDESKPKLEKCCCNLRALLCCDSFLVVLRLLEAKQVIYYHSMFSKTNTSLQLHTNLITSRRHLITFWMLERPRFKPSTAHVGIYFEKSGPKAVFLQTLWFSPVTVIQQCSILIYHKRLPRAFA